MVTHELSATMTNSPWLEQVPEDGFRVRDCAMLQLSRAELAQRGLDARRWQAAGLDELDGYQTQLRHHAARRGARCTPPTHRHGSAAGGATDEGGDGSTTWVCFDQEYDAAGPRTRWTALLLPVVSGGYRLKGWWCELDPTAGTTLPSTHRVTHTHTRTHTGLLLPGSGGANRLRRIDDSCSLHTLSLSFSPSVGLVGDQLFVTGGECDPHHVKSNAARGGLVNETYWHYPKITLHGTLSEL
eukprot:COSAG05_NODE_5161_length_1249_cov_0.894783_2_plen_242_part_00